MKCKISFSIKFFIPFILILSSKLGFTQVSIGTDTQTGKPVTIVTPNSGINTTRPAVSVGTDAQTGMPVTVITPNGGINLNQSRRNSAVTPLNAFQDTNQYIDPDLVMRYNGKKYYHYNKSEDLQKLVMYFEFLHIIDYSIPQDQQALYMIEDKFNKHLTQLKHHFEKLIEKRKEDFLKINQP